MSSSEKAVVQWWDAHVERPATLDLSQLNGHLDDVYKILNAHIQKLSKVGDWELNEIDVSLDVKGNVLMVSLDGAVKLAFKKPGS